MVTAAVRSVEAEFVAFGVLHNDADAIDAVGFKAADTMCAESEQTSALRFEGVGSALWRYAGGSP